MVSPPLPFFPPLPQLWLCLAALCVLDEEQAEALSSGQWLGQDGKPKVKVRVQRGGGWVEGRPG